jgi:hypothetical protein
MTYPVKVTLPLNTKACVQAGWIHTCENGVPRILTTWDDPLIVAVALLGEMTAEEILALDWGK